MNGLYFYPSQQGSRNKKYLCLKVIPIKASVLLPIVFSQKSRHNTTKSCLTATAPVYIKDALKWLLMLMVLTPAKLNLNFPHVWHTHIPTHYQQTPTERWLSESCLFLCIVALGATLNPSSSSKHTHLTLFALLTWMTPQTVRLIEKRRENRLKSHILTEGGTKAFLGIKPPSNHLLNDQSTLQPYKTYISFRKCSNLFMYIGTKMCECREKRIMHRWRKDKGRRTVGKNKKTWFYFVLWVIASAHTHGKRWKRKKAILWYCNKTMPFVIW